MFARSNIQPIGCARNMDDVARHHALEYHPSNIQVHRRMAKKGQDKERSFRR